MKAQLAERVADAARGSEEAERKASDTLEALQAQRLEAEEAWAAERASLATFRMSVPSVSSNIRKFGVVAVEVISALLMYRWSAG